MRSQFFIAAIITLSFFGFVGFALPSKAASLPEPKTARIIPQMKEDVREVTGDITRPILVAILLLSLFGVGETAYVMRTRLTKKPAVCPIGDHKSCDVVLESKYNKSFGIHNDLLGFLYYVTIALLATALNIGFGPTSAIRVMLIGIVAIGACMSIYLTYLQARVIKAWCFWCLTSAFTTWFLAVIIFSRALVA